MNDITKQKYIVLQDIFANYKNYKGYQESRLESNLKALEHKLENQDFEELMLSFAKYTDYVLAVLAGTHRVRVKFDNFYSEYSDINPNAIFND